MRWLHGGPAHDLRLVDPRRVHVDRAGHRPVESQRSSHGRSRIHGDAQDLSAAPTLVAPATGATFDYPDAVGMLRWSVVPHAAYYQVQVSDTATFPEPLAPSVCIDHHGGHPGARRGVRAAPVLACPRRGRLEAPRGPVVSGALLYRSLASTDADRPSRRGGRVECGPDLGGGARHQPVRRPGRAHGRYDVLGADVHGYGPGGALRALVGSDIAHPVAGPRPQRLGQRYGLVGGSHPDRGSGRRADDRTDHPGPAGADPPGSERRRDRGGSRRDAAALDIGPRDDRLRPAHRRGRPALVQPRQRCAEPPGSAAGRAEPRPRGHVPMAGPGQ